LDEAAKDSTGEPKDVFGRLLREIEVAKRPAAGIPHDEAFGLLLEQGGGERPSTA